MEAHSSSRSSKATDDVPSNNTGRLDANSFRRVNNTALSCSCACHVKNQLISYITQAAFTQESFHGTKGYDKDFMY
jgi:hypothetical protein